MAAPARVTARPWRRARRCHIPQGHSMPPRSPPPDKPDIAALGQVLSGFFDAAWYRSRYPDVQATGVDPMTHFLTWGAADGRDPNRWFDSRWYAQRYPDLAGSGAPPLLH